MKPRSKKELMFVSMAERLHALTDRQKEYGYNLFEKKGYTKNNEVWCQCCGAKMPSHFRSLCESIDFQCPECGHFLNLYPKKGKYNNEEKIVSYITTHNGYTVIRTCMFSRYNTYGKKTEYDISEVYQNWIDDKGKEHITGKDYSRGVNFFRWKYESKYSIKHHNEHVDGCYIFDDVFNPDENYFYQKTRVTPLLKRNGWSDDLLKETYNPYSLIKGMLSSNDIEWLVKIREYEILKYMLSNKKDAIPYRHAVKIANKNGYKIDDVDVWFDYLDLLSYFRKDTHNARYVCPENLNKEHNRLSAKKSRIMKEKILAENTKKARLHDLGYATDFKEYIGIAFDDGTIFCHVLNSVTEFAEEGTCMNHCVYSNEYWNKKRHPYSLILSATDVCGKRIETIEVNTKIWKVVQSRGKCNHITDFHDEIIKLVEKNMYMLRSASFSVMETIKMQKTAS